MIYWLIRFVNTYRQYIILTILILFCFLLLSLNNSKQISNLRKFSFVLYGVIDYIKSPFEDFLFYKKELELLRKENSELVKQLAELRSFERERKELLNIQEFRKLNSVNYLPARVIVKTSSANENKFIIDKGHRDGVKLNAVVLNSKGLIGYISEISDHYSYVHTIQNLNMRISVRNDRTNASGILLWDGNKFKIYNLNKSEDVKEGDIFVTSEFSIQFPSDIPVVKIIYVSRETFSYFYDITGESTADLNNTRYCLVRTSDLEKNKLKFLLK